MRSFEDYSKRASTCSQGSFLANRTDSPKKEGAHTTNDPSHYFERKCQMNSVMQPCFTRSPFLAVHTKQSRRARRPHQLTTMAIFTLGQSKEKRTNAKAEVSDQKD